MLVSDGLAMGNGPSESNWHTALVARHLAVVRGSVILARLALRLRLSATWFSALFLMFDAHHQACARFHQAFRQGKIHKYYFLPRFQQC